MLEEIWSFAYVKIVFATFPLASIRALFLELGLFVLHLLFEGCCWSWCYYYSSLRRVMCGRETGCRLMQIVFH